VIQVDTVVQVHVVQVFTDEYGGHGNPLGVVFNDSARLGDDEMQALATHLGYSETVYVQDAVTGLLRLFTPACELPFAGHPLVGTSWLLARETGIQLPVLRPSRLEEPVPTFVEDGITWIRGAVAHAPKWDHVQLPDSAAVEALRPPARGERWQRTQLWAWEDEPAGIIRARVFALDFDVVEDEACGSATLMLAAILDRPITVRHGRNSVVLARPSAEAGYAEIGGRVAYAGQRAVPLPIAPTVPAR
jgi:predicted PhzF superfamily epimerase YddE/YHI9